MTLAQRIVLFALALNIIVLVPVLAVLVLGLPPAERGFGPLGAARLILTAIYIAIAVVSAALIALHLKHLAWAMPMSVALFAVQVTYKLITVPLVGLSNPVVITNLGVAAVQIFALAMLWRGRGQRAC